MPLGSEEETAAELLAVLRRLKGRDAALALAAEQTAQLAHQHGAGLVAVVEHPQADPALLTAWTMATRVEPTAAAELGRYLSDAGGPDIREVTRTETARGYPVVIVERISISGAQLQVVVVDPTGPRLAVFTLHSVTGRGWVELAALAGRFVSGLEFGPDPGTRSASGRSPSGTPGRSARR